MRATSTLVDVGLGLCARRPAGDDLSGEKRSGEARIRAVEARNRAAIYIPPTTTTGCHFYDIQQVGSRAAPVVDQGNT